MIPATPPLSPGLIAATLMAGGLGALLRFGVSRWMATEDPDRVPTLGTWVANLAGAGAAGLGLWLHDLGLLGTEGWFVLSAGLLGALTTYSTWMLEVAVLLRSGARSRALRYLLGTMALGLLLASVGIGLSLR